MKLEQAHIDHIITAFKKMQSKEDLLQLLNEAKPLVYGEKALPFQLKQLTWYSNPKLGGKRYAEFKIKKKSGTDRSIHAPVKGLKSLQKTLSFVLQCVFEPHHAAMGFVRDKSIVDNARLHEASKYVYNIDLKDFFPSVDQARVWKCLQLKPFNLTDSDIASEEENTTKLQTGVRKFITDHKERIYYKIQDNSLILVIDKKGNYRKYKKRLTGHLVKPIVPLLSTEAGEKKQLREYNQQVNEIIFEDAKRYILSTENIEALNRLVSSRKNLANIIASLCCTEMEVERKNATGEWEKVKRNVLPQGAPTSPVITNIVCQRLDHLLSGVARRFGLKYSRYADDITFSSMHNVYQPESEFLKELQRIILEQGFHIKESKTRLQKDGYRKEVTGLLVNEKANVQQRYIKQLRKWLYYWERYGYERASGYFLQEYIIDKGHVMKGKPDMANVIAGKLDYLKMVKGNENPLYLKLKSRLDALIKVEEIIRIVNESIPSEKRLPLINIDNIKDSDVGKLKTTTGKLRISINSLDSVKSQVKLKRKIIIEKGENLPLEEVVENHEYEEKEIDLSKHKPIDVTRFLLNFRASEGLKFLTHDYDKTDSLFDYADILKVAKKEFEDLSSQFIIPPNLWARINQFAFGDPNKIWRFDKVIYKHNWKSPELLSWIDANPHTHPIKNEDFEKGFITPFKKSIEIKAPELENIFKNKLAENLGSKYISFDIKMLDLNTANFYTNVDAFQVGISYLIKAIKQRFSNSNKLRIEFSRKADAEGRKRIIKIIHIGSECNKPLDKNELFQGDLLEAEKAFFGICDWSIISKSPDDSVNVLNVLFDISSAKVPKEKIDDSLIEGFTHILTFYS